MPMKPDTNGAGVSKKLKSELTDLKGGEVIFVWVPIENSVNSNVEMLRQTLELGYKCIYVSLNKDVGSLLQIYERAGLDTTRILFIDGIARLYSSALVDAPNILYVASPLATEEILETIKKNAAQSPGEKKMVYFDSLTSILIYNSPEKTDVFIKKFAELLKKLNAVGIGVSVSIGAHDTRLLEQLRKISNKIIDLTEAAK